jgi:hypothetical protein
MGMSLTTDEKGEIAVLKVRLRAFELQWAVLVPTIPRRYDLVLEREGTFVRAQVKYADCPAPHATGALQLDLRRRKRIYTRDEIDALLVNIPQTDKVYWFPPEVFHQKMVLHLRLLPAKNNQRNRCLMAADYVW